MFADEVSQLSFVHSGSSWNFIELLVTSQRLDLQTVEVNIWGFVVRTWLVGDPSKCPLPLGSCTLYLGFMKIADKLWASLGREDTKELISLDKSSFGSSDQTVIWPRSTYICIERQLQLSLHGLLYAFTKASVACLTPALVTILY